ncbi:MAG TPA: FAD-dependent thymidylate synthase [Dissulfurispiraceae bacterium]|nr:FAD-dependent thymidylate synthase [Dissulfurispiraceae bacterium]
MPEAKLKVILVRYTPSPEETIALAAKLCYSSADVASLREKIEKKDQRSFIEKLIRIGHISPIEHTSFTFAIEGISRACSHQLVRHRIASYSQQSQRYVGEESGFEYIIPPSISKDRKLKELFERAMESAQEAYSQFAQHLRKMKLSSEEANQDARFVLPNAAETKIIVTMNARELHNFFRQRCCRRAQWEIRAMAKEMLFQVSKVAPILFQKAGPACLYSQCREGEMSCGKARSVRKEFGSKYRGPSRTARKKTIKPIDIQNRLFQ